MKQFSFDKCERAIGLALLSAIVILVFLASVMRFVGKPLIWSVDFAQLLFIWLCFIGANRALRTKSHLGVDLFIRNFPRRMRLLLETVVSLFIVAFLISLAIKGAELTMLNKERLFGDSGIPYAFVTIAVPCGCLLLCSTIVSNAVFAWKKNQVEGTLILTKNAIADQDEDK